MNKSLLFSISVGIVFLFVSSTVNAATVNVTMQNFAFQPATMTINMGDTVVWTNMDNTIHTSTSGSDCTPSGMWDSGDMAVGQTFSLTFNTPGTFPYHCTHHCATNNMVGTIIVNAATGATLPILTGPFVTTFQPVGSPALSSDPAHAEPIGVGNVQGGTLSLQIGLDAFAAPWDVYFFIFVPSIDPNDIFQLTASNTLQPLSMGFAPLISNTSGPVSEALLGNITISVLPHGTYFFAVLVTPPGDTSLTRFDLWITALTL